MNKQTVAVIGLGYIGLPTAAILASKGHRVIGVDLDTERMDAVNRGELPFVEPGLETLLSEAVSSGNLTAQADIPEADAYIVAVPTPHDDAHQVDMRYIDAASKSLAPKLGPDALVILESTTAPGTTERMADVILAERPDLSADGSQDRPIVHFAHCPERVLPGRIMVELTTNDRVIGGVTPKAAELARDLYASFCEGQMPLTDARTAEMAKLTENSFRDVNIAFANELSIICDRLGIDVWELIELANLHPRVNILQPGPGVGGHCIAVDPWFIVSSAPDESKLIKQARLVNDSKPDIVIDKVVAAADGESKPVVAALGLAFKPDIDDLRESPALDITRRLAEKLPHATILAVEPNVHEMPAALRDLDNVELTDLDSALDRASAIAMLVDHSEFKAVDRAKLGDKPVIDTRGVWR